MEKLLDNSVRGARTLFWMKAFFVVSMVVIALGYSIFHFTQGPMDSPESQATTAMGMILTVLGLIAAFICMMVVIIALVVYWVKWLFRSTQNLHKLNPSSLEPWLATVLCCIPFVGQIIHYFVLRNLVKGVQTELDSRNVQYAPVSLTMMNLYLVFTVVAALLASFSGVSEIVFAGQVLGFVALALYIRVFAIYAEQEKLLFKAHEEEVLRQKVDQVLREREIEKAASQVQAATYESEKSSTEKSEGPVTYADDAPPPPPEK